MNDEAFVAIVVMTVAILLPLIPAFLLFRYLPSAGEASGPLAGLTVKFSGAFAGYLILFLSLLYIRPESGEHFHRWEVIGTIDVQPASGEPEPNLNDVFVRFVPPQLGVMGNGANQAAFKWEVPVVENADGSHTFPDLQIDLRNFRGTVVPLGPGVTYGAHFREIRRDHKARQLFITAPIVLQSIAASQVYKPTQAEQAVAIR